MKFTIEITEQPYNRREIEFKGELIEDTTGETWEESIKVGKREIQDCEGRRLGYEKLASKLCRQILEALT